MSIVVIDKYQIVEKDDLSSLHDTVNALLKDFWEPYGSPIVHQFDSVSRCYCQAMILRRKTWD